MHAQTTSFKFFSLVSLLLLIPTSLWSQGAPLTVGPVTVTIPAGWTGKSGFPGERERFFSPESTLEQYFALGVSSSQISEDVLTHHSAIVKNLSGIAAPGTSPQSGTLGQFLWTRIMIQRPLPRSKPETLILYSLKAGSTYVSIDVDATSTDLLTADLPAVEAMIRAAVVNNSADQPTASAHAASVPTARNSAPFPSQPSSTQQPATSSAAWGSTTAQMPTGPASLTEYTYSVPPGWTPKQYPDGLVLFSPVSNTGEQCQISMWPMRPASNNLLNDAASAFQQVFSGFEPRSKTSDGFPVEPSLIRGTAGAGWNYAIIKRGIGRHGPYETLLGSVMAAKLNNMVAIVSTISKRPLVSTCLGELIKDAWPKFFYSLGFKSWVAPDQGSAMKQSLLGTWTLATSTVADQITFAANGRYGGASAAQNYNLLGNGTVLTTTQGFFGDGAYSVKGNTIQFKPDSQNRAPYSGLFRIEEESKDGGRTWTRALYLLRVSTVDGSEYEVRYHKTGN